MTDNKRVALVTGAANGIGEATALRLLKNGYRVVAVDLKEIDPRKYDSFGDDVAFCVADVSKEDDVAIAVKVAGDKFGQLDVLVNNAGISLPKSIDDTSVEDWDRVQGVNLRSAYLFIRLAKPLLERSKAAAVVNVASFHAHATIGNFAAYAASKAGVVGFTRSISVELAPLGIRVNAVAPGVIHTAMLQEWLDSVPDPQAAVDQMNEKQPLGRIGKPDEAAAAIAFLGSEDASFIHGTTLYVDGGVTARLWHP